MAREYAREICKIDDPRVALLSVGGEAGKGNPLVKEAFAALKAMKGLRFVGNVEGQQIFSGDVDVVVCEGFVGNVILKASEGMAEAWFHMLFQELGESLGNANPAAKQVLGHLKARTDYAVYGGAPLMGHEAAVFISHGRSKATAMKNAIRFADSFVGHSVNARITDALAVMAADPEVLAALSASS
jgi:glycerol-3-phosphate acyltransferase PlsX